MGALPPSSLTRLNGRKRVLEEGGPAPLEDSIGRVDLRSICVGERWERRATDELSCAAQP